MEQSINESLVPNCTCVFLYTRNYLNDTRSTIDPHFIEAYTPRCIYTRVQILITQRGNILLEILSVITIRLIIIYFSDSFPFSIHPRDSIGFVQPRSTTIKKITLNIEDSKIWTILFSGLYPCIPFISMIPWIPNFPPFCSPC